MRKYDESKISKWLLKENLMWNNPVVAWTMLTPVSMPGFLYNVYQKGAVARFFTERDIRVDYKHNARSGDLREVLANEDYQNVVVMGHGGRSQWCVRDGTVYAEDLDKWMGGLPKKKGYFIQFTCGDEEGKPLGYSVVEDRSKILGYAKPVHLGDRFDSLWGESLKGIEGLVSINEEVPTCLK